LYTVTGIGPDGTLFGVATGREPGSDWDLVSLHPGDTLRNVLATRYAEGWPSLSPNGEWLAYASNESGRPETYIRRVDGAGGRLQVSLDGASEPLWSRNGHELFYRRLAPTGSELVLAELVFSPEPRVIARRTLFDATDYEAAVPHANYDVSPDGQHIAMVRRTKARGLVYLQNVPELARARTARPDDGAR
jgi:Tol biopolymer transport system component